MSMKNNILYGGYVGSDKEICQNAQSLGEAILNKLREADQKIILVKCLLLSWFRNFNYILFISCRLMVLMEKKSVHGTYSQKQYVWQNIYKKILASNQVMLFQFAVKIALNLL